ncbi:hypothetical protein UFOVP496_14 [uncultured Caudovirales phage]|uniref:EF-hand domain-containing protein n=1 Tax=uncultured Caudovirales phage TaxID=2100421 RepID=A0A6J5MJA7_9CAUD|nr:hypothetical protein UFOVP496_14 [uncultured Caudovirales phage]
MTPIAFQTDLDAQNRTIGSDVNRNGMPVVTDAVVPTRVDPLATTVKIMRGKDKLEPAPPTPPEQPIAIAPPQKVGVPSATDTIKEMLDSRRNAIYHAAMRSSGGNPDADAKTLQAARDSGTSYDFVLQNMEQTQRRLFGREVAKLDLPKNAPVLAEKLATDPDFARVANDDLANLKEQEGWWSWFAHQFTGIPTAFMHGFAGYEHAESGAMQVFGPSPLHPTMWSMADPQTFENRNAQLNAQELTFDPEREVGVLPVFNMLGQTAYQFARAVPAAGGGAIVGGLTGGLVGVSPLPWMKAATPITTLVGAQLGAKAGLSAALIDDQVRQAAGMMYNRMIDEGVDPNVARWKAASWGLALGGIQVGLMKVLYPKIATSILETEASKAAADKLLAKKLAAAIADPSMKGVVKRISAQTAQTTAKILGSVGGAVIMFEAANEDGRRASNLPMRSASPEGRAELIDIAVNNFKFMATGAVGLHVLMPSAHNPIMELGRERSRIRAAEKQAEGFETLSILQKASKLAVRSPEDAQSLMEGTLTGTPIEDILISKEGIQRAMATLEIPMAKLDEVIPGALAQFNDVASGTAESGGYIKVKTADFKARIEKTPLGSLLLGDVTWSAEIGTMRESAARSAFLKTFISEINENVEKFADEVNEAINKDDANRESAEKVANVIEAQLIGEGRTAEQARTESRFLGAIAFAGAARESEGKSTRMTPEEFHRKYPIHIAERESEKPSEPAREVAAPTETAAQVKPVVPTTVDPTSRPRTVAEMLVENRRAEEAQANEPVGQMSRQGNDAVVEAIANLREANETHKGFAKDEGSTAKTASMHEMMSDQIAAVEREVKAGDAVGLEIEIAILQEMLRAGNIREARNAVKQPGIAKQLATTAQRLIDTARDELDRIIESTPKTGEEDTLNQPLTTMVPSTKNVVLDPTIVRNPSFEEAVKPDEKTRVALEKNVLLFDTKEFTSTKSDGTVVTERAYNSIKVEGNTAQERAENIIQQMVRNLLEIHDRIPEATRKRSKLWYMGANRLSRVFAKRYGLTDRQSAAGLAVLSPQADWRMNISYWERILDISRHRQQYVWDAKMTSWADGYIESKTEEWELERLALEKSRDNANKSVLVAGKAIEGKQKKYESVLAEVDAREQLRLAELQIFEDQAAEVKAARERRDITEKAAKEQRQEIAEKKSKAREAVDKARDKDKNKAIKARQELRSAETEKRQAEREAIKRQAKVDEGNPNLLVQDFIRGMSLANVESDYARAWWIRAYDEAHNPRAFRDVTPEGDFLDFVKTDKGNNYPIGWKSFDGIAKAVSIIRDGSIENIHDQLGNEHKVRSFYNNIYAPNSLLPFLTSDTHQVAADLMEPLGSSAIEVSHNFGTGKGVGVVGPQGLKGTYWMHAEAVVRAARERGLIPREMQSITWEAIRGLFKDTFKQDEKNLESVRDLWDRYRNGEATYEETFESIVKLAAGFTEPSWVGIGSDRFLPAERGHSSYENDLAHSGVTLDESALTGEERPRNIGDVAADVSQGESGVLEQSAPVSPEFFSALKRSVDAVDAKELTGAQWKDRIATLVNKGEVKEEEIYWTGFYDFLDMQREGKITKEELAAFLQNNGVKVEEIRLANITSDQMGIDDRAMSMFGRRYDDLTVVQMAEVRDVQEKSGVKSPPQYEVLTLPNGTNYREVLLTLPAFSPPVKPVTAETLAARTEIFERYEPALKEINEKIQANVRHSNDMTAREMDAHLVEHHNLKIERHRLESARDQEARQFPIPEPSKPLQWIIPHFGSHGRNNNVLASVRLNDRVSQQGERVLHDEENQSDYAAKGRKWGFEAKERMEKLSGNMLERELLRRESELRQRSIASSFAAYRALDAIDNMGFDDGNRSAPLNLLQEESNWTFENGGLDLRGLTEDQVSDLRQHVANLQEQRNLYRAQDKNESLVRRAPFVTSTDGWVNLSIKHMLMEAVKGDYKYLSFITGDQSVDRYKEGLVEETSKVQIRKNEDGTYNFYASLIDESKSDKSESHVSADRIQELFGEQGAKKLVGAADAEPSKAVILEENIPIGGAGMRKFYDSMLIDAVNKISKKLGGGKVELLTMSDGTVQPALEITDAMRAKINEAGGMPLFQAASKKPARASFNPKTFEVKLGHHSDMTSWVHESSHYLFETYHRMILDGSAPKWVADDFQTLLTFFGVKDNAEWNTLSFEARRKHYEKFSYNFEIYMAEGKAPTIALQPLFDRFKSWIIQVYTDVVKHQNTLYKEQFGEELPPLTDEVRRVMDRMLATEEQIRSTAEARDMKAMFQTQEEAGVSDAAWAEYQTVLGASHRDAVNELTARSMRDFQWVGNMKSKFLKELAKKNAATRRAVRDEVEEQVRAEPIFRAIDFLKYGMTTSENGERVSAENVGKLNLADAKAVLGDEAAKLGYGKYGMIAKDGMPADLVAELFGFKSGDELLRALAAAKKVGDEIDARTDERMMKEFGDLNDPERMEQAANAALHNDARARAVATELNFITKALTPVKEMVAAAREAAVDHINNRKIKDVKAHEFAVAEAKAARAARSTADSKVNPEAIGKSAGTRAYNKAIANGVDEAAAVKLGEDAATTAAANAQERINLHKKQYGDVDPMESARRAKQHQLFNNQLAAVAGEVQEEVRDTVRGFSKFFKADSKIGKSRDIEMVMAARSILSAFGFGRSDKAPIEYVKQIEAFNPELFAALEPIIARASRGAQDYREMTVAEFRALSDGVTALWNDARRDKQIMVGEKKVALAQVVGELVDRTNELGVPTEMAGDKSAPTRRQRMMRTLNGVKNMMRRVEHWCDAMDGLDNTGGPFTKYIFRPIVDAMDAYRADRTKYLKRYAELCATIELPKGRIAAPELDYTFGVGNGGVGKSELLGALLHMGNDGNMRKLLIGRKWGELDAEGNLDASRMMKFINRMVTEGKLVKADFDFVQSVWDLNEELKPMAQKSHRDLYGFYFKEVEATPLNTPFGTYRGGYVPAKPDPFMVKDAQRNAKMDALEGNFNQVMPSTGLGFTKSRVEYNRPLALDLRMIGKHIDDVIRFAHVQPAIKDVLKVIGNEEFSSALSKIDPTAIETMLVPFLGRAARHTAVEQGRFKAVDDFWIAVRGRTSLMFMSLNLRQLGDVGGISVALTKVKSGQLAAAMKQYLDSPHAVATMIAEASPMMDERLTNQNNDTRARIDDLIGNQSGLGKAQALARKHGMFLNTVLHNQLDIVTWLGAYNQAIAEIAASAGDKEAQREAVSRADAAVRLTQGAMNPEDVAAYEQGTPFYRTITQFTTYLNTLANLNADEYGKIVRELGIRKGAGKLVQAHILAYAVPMIIFGVWTDLISGGWDDDDESWAAHALSVLFGSYFSGGIGMLPFGSQVQGIAEATIAKSIGGSVIRNKEHINVSPSINALEGGVVGAADSAYRAVSGKEITGKNIKDALTLVSLFTGIPLNPIGKTVGYAVDVNNNKIQPTGTADYIRGLITGSASPESKK